MPALSGSVLGLQRSTQLTRAPALSLIEDEGISFQDVSVLGLQRSAKIIRKSPPVEVDEDDYPDAGLSLPDVSVLGLQRSVKMKRVTIESSEDDVMELHQGTSASTGGMVLGLQRSAQLLTAQAPPTEDIPVTNIENKKRPRSSARVKPKVAVKNSPVLGFQRSMQLSKTRLI